MLETGLEYTGMMTRAKRRKMEQESQLKRAQSEFVPQNDNRPNNGNTYRGFTIVLKRLTEEDLQKANFYETTVAKASEPSVSETQNNAEKNDVRIPLTIAKVFEPVVNKTHNNAEKNDVRIPLTIAVPEYTLRQIVWGRIKGSVPWPAKIDRIITTAKGKLTYELLWYNDYRRTKVQRLQVFKFLENFDEFAKNFDSTVGLKTAAFEAMYEYRQRINKKKI